MNWSRLPKSILIRKGQIFVLFASLGFSFIFVFSTLLKEVGVPSLEQVFFRVLLSALILFTLLKGKPTLPSRKDVLFFASIGFVFAIFLASGLSAIVFNIPIAVVSSLFNTQPIFTALAVFVAGKEKITRARACVIAIGVLGALQVTGLSLEQVLTLRVGPGVILSLSGGALYALYLFMKRIGQTRYRPLDLLFNTYLFALPWTLVVGLVVGCFSNNPMIASYVILDSYQLLLLSLFAMISTVFPYSLLNKVNPKVVSPTAEGTILLLDPVLHAFWAILLFQQFVSPVQYVGILLVLASSLGILLPLGDKTRLE